MRGESGEGITTCPMLTVLSTCIDDTWLVAAPVERCNHAFVLDDGRTAKPRLVIRPQTRRGKAVRPHHALTKKGM